MGYVENIGKIHNDAHFLFLFFIEKPLTKNKIPDTTSNTIKNKLASKYKITNFDFL
jgi:hypothetical protein